MKSLVALLALATSSQLALAGVCAYTPSKLVGAGTAGGVATGAGAAAAAGVALKAAGVYVITNATTGAVMLGSTAAGASAAGTAGIVAGTAGFVGSTGAVLMSPFLIVPAAIAAGGIAVYEGGCYLTEKKEQDKDYSK